MTDAREPLTDDRRLSGVSARPPMPGPHETHDLTLVVDLATGGELDPTSATVARGLVATCPECASIAADIGAIARATAASVVPPRTRDFRLTPGQAAALQPSRLRRFAMRLASTNGTVLRPLAGSILAVGLVLTVVGTAIPGAPATAPQNDAAAQVGAPADTASTAAVLPANASATSATGPERAVPAPAADAEASPLMAPAAKAPAASGSTSDVQTAAVEPEPTEAGPASAIRAMPAASAPSVTSGEPASGDLAAPLPAGSEALGAGAPPSAGETGEPAVEVAPYVPAAATDGSQVTAAAGPHATPSAAPGVASATRSEERGAGAPFPAVVLLGLALAVIGATVLVLGAIARRVGDPLLR
jgi:DNA polymerase-3 subunit gamma/tau